MNDPGLILMKHDWGMKHDEPAEWSEGCPIGPEHQLLSEV